MTTVPNIKSHRFARFGLTAVLAFATLLSTGQSHADVAAPTPSLADSLSGPAKVAYEEGKTLYELKDFAGAIPKLKVAHALSGDFRLLKNIAACERALLHYGRTYTLLEQYLSEAKGKLPPEQVAATEANMASLRAFFSTVKLTIEPVGASVKVDAVEVGKSPLAPLALDTGIHKLHIEMEGFEPNDSVVEAPGKSEIILAIRLRPVALTIAKLSVVASEGDAITIDGVMSGLGKYEGQVAPGSHTVAIRGAGKKPFSERIELAPGASRDMRITLVDASSSGGVPTWLWITGGAVVASGLAVGSYFLFKPGDEPGKRPTGGLDTFSLKLLRGIRF